MRGGAGGTGLDLASPAISSSKDLVVAALMAIYSARAASLSFLLLVSLCLIFCCHFLGVVLDVICPLTWQSGGVLDWNWGEC